MRPQRARWRSIQSAASLSTSGSSERWCERPITSRRRTPVSSSTLRCFEIAGWLTEKGSASSATDKANATWIVRAGLANTSCLSFESVDKPGQFLRHYNYQLNLNFDDGGSAFAQDATFCRTPGNSGVGNSFQSVNFPTKYLRHYNYTVYIASNGGSNAWDATTSWAQDTSWLTASPWS